MGLDMYLKGRMYVTGYQEDEAEQFSAIIDAVGARAYVDPDKWNGIQVDLPVGYWRKANHIHGWFVREVQGGEDECEEHYVSRERLVELRDICTRLLADRHPERAMSALPPVSGFFFGADGIGDWYWDDLTRTVAIIDRALSAPEQVFFYYQSSW